MKISLEPYSEWLARHGIDRMPTPGWPCRLCGQALARVLPDTRWERLVYRLGWRVYECGNCPRRVLRR